MSNRSTVFAQIMQYLDPTEFARCVARFPAPRRPRSLSGYDHFLALCFAQLTYRESLRDIAACLGARPARGYHLGFRSRITRTNLAYANHHRDWRGAAAVAQLLMRKARRLYQAEAAVDPELPSVVYALDASVIELSLALFPWARWHRSFAGMKLHSLLSVRGQIPVWTAVTEARFPEQKTLDQVPLEPGAFYVMDRGYLDFGRLARLDRAEVYFVVRTKCHVRFRVRTSRAVDKSTGLRCDQTVQLTSSWSRHAFPGPLRRIRIRDEAAGRSLVLLTNHFDLPARLIGELYRRRWQVELFFKWIKQHLRLRGFFGRTPNAVRTQIWSAIGAYLLVAIARKRLGLSQSLHQILQIVSVSAFEQTPLPELLAENNVQNQNNTNSKQLCFNGI
jgi:hypothetical protein